MSIGQEFNRKKMRKVTSSFKKEDSKTDRALDGRRNRNMTETGKNCQDFLSKERGNGRPKIRLQRF